jgi:hypothetical protein
MQRAGIRDILSGLIFVGFGAAFGYAATGYPIGTAFRMGPGYFPLVLAGLMALLGLAIVAKGLTAAAAERELGLVPCLFGAAFLSALASRRNGPASALVIAAALTLLCVLIFHYGLGLPLPLFGPWLR